MGSVLKKLSILFTACRGYSLPISLMSWLVPFLFALMSGGSLFSGLIALFGIIVLHMGVNIFDDAIDYTLAKKRIEKGKQEDFNFQQGKCIYIFNKELSLKQYYIISISLFLMGLLIGLFFLTVVGLKLLYIIIPTAILCLLYPILGYLGLGEVIVATIFSPLLYSGVYFVMTGKYSYEILILSISTGFLVVSVLHNHMLMDYKLDEKSRKITLCRLCKSEKNALRLLGIIIILAYINILFWILLGNLDICYLISFLSLPFAIKLYKDMGNPQIEFLEKFLLPEKLLSIFTLLLCISIVVEKCIL